jgi:hypothetical protein
LQEADVPHPSDAPSKSDREAKFDGSLVTHTLREAKWIVGIWAISFLWVIGYCSRFGVTSDVEPIATVGGIPSWVFWGIALPWVIATIVTCWFALGFIVDEPLDGQGLDGDGLGGGAGTTRSDDD